MSIKVSCGIDFGTSNSAVAISDKDGVSVVPIEHQNKTLPSCIFYGEEEIQYGRQAIKSYIEGEEGRLLRGLKTILGTDLMQEKTRIGRKSYSFVDILTTYMLHLKTQAEKYAGVKIENVVLGRPVHFHDNNPEADDVSEKILRDIAFSIGYKNIEFQLEPIAAAFAHEIDLEEETLAMVIDLGGGTSDFTVMRLSPGKSLAKDRSKDILSTSGVRIGGTVFDRDLSIKAFMPELGLGSSFGSPLDADKKLHVPTAVFHTLSEWSQIRFSETRKAIADTKALLRTSDDPQKLELLLKVQEDRLGHLLLQSVEESKIALTDNETWIAKIPEISSDFRVSVTREDFESAIKDRVSKIQLSIEECLQKAGICKDNIGLVILTGGSTEIPIVNKLVQETFPNAKISSGNKFDSVARGLGYFARNVF